MSEAKTVKEEDLMTVLSLIVDLRGRCIKGGIDPWALRQGLIMALEIDTEAAVSRGVSRKQLEKFDSLVKKDIRAWLRRIGEDWPIEG